MRIVGGMWRGHALVAPKGDSTRPTSDRVREAIFSMLEARWGQPDGAVVLDAFAGSGALGLEALSRGAETAVFVERESAALRALETNIERLDPRRAVVVRGDVRRLPSTRMPDTPPFTLLLLDPPYRIEPVQVMTLVDGLADAGRIAGEAVVVYEHDVRSPVAWPARFLAEVGRRYGSTLVDVAVYREG